ncbi:hypothetical protein [Henriciella marina]|uniref:Uncharacterized protein n=1 Tax=Henriciella marina TaxID=453851 RepID=A0ABT4LUC1_9PROT|nr:hypothetical protein [Henriciella marina]MCZ4297722.1 hypothetical protein [Henriciella marina]
MTIHRTVVSQTARPYCNTLPGHVAKIMGKYAIRRAGPGEIIETLRLGEALIGGALARPEVVGTIDAITQMTIWNTGDPIAGVFLLVPVTEEGRAAVENGSFNPADPAIRHIAPAGTPIFGVYCGIYAGATRDARKSVLMAAADLRLNAFAPVPTYARGATEDGARSMLRLGYRPVSGGLKDLFVSDPVSAD